MSTPKTITPKMLLPLLLSLMCLSQSALAQAPPQTQQRSLVLASASVASRQRSTLSADVLLTWNTGGILHQTKGTIQLAKPNLGRIVLQGDYPEVLLLSDGRTRYLAASEDKFQQAPMDERGAGLDSPWWGLPFRFFFTQSVNPFGAEPDKSATYEETRPHNAGGASLSGLLVKGNSPMGGYTEELYFNATGDLVESSVQFGDGPNASQFQATLTDVRHPRIAESTFRFTPATGQKVSTSTDGMLPLGAATPALSLRTTDGKLISLDQELRGKKAVLVNFWYYQCAPCRIEFPEFESLYKQFADQGFSILAVDKGDSAAVVARYAKSAGLTFPIVLGGDEVEGSIFDRFRVTDAFPGTYLLNEHGRIVYRSTGADIAGLRRALAALGLKSR